MVRREESVTDFRKSRRSQVVEVSWYTYAAGCNCFLQWMQVNQSERFLEPQIAQIIYIITEPLEVIMKDARSNSHERLC
jgi:hypothetical protein